mgnify:CR=1 FL=1
MSVAARLPVPGTVARGAYQSDRTFFTGLPEQPEFLVQRVEPADHLTGASALTPGQRAGSGRSEACGSRIGEHPAGLILGNDEKELR